MLIPDRTVDCQETLELRRWETMKFTDKFKAKKTENQENPVNEASKKEKKPLKQKIKDSMNKKYLKNGSYSVVISAIFVVIVLVVNMICLLYTSDAADEL